MYALQPVYDFRVVEEEVRRFWEERNIPKKFLELNRGGPIFSFLKGPPTVNTSDKNLQNRGCEWWRVWRRGS